MTNKKIFANEILSDDQLDNISGGNFFQTEALCDAFRIEGLVEGGDNSAIEEKLKERLLKEFDVKVTKWNTNNGSDNEYAMMERRTGKLFPVNHRVVIEMVRDKYPYRPG